MLEKQKTIARSLSGAFKGVTLTHSKAGDLIIDVSAFKGANVTLISSSEYQIVNQTPTEEQTNVLNVTRSSVDSRAVQIGDVLGQSFDLPEGLERLNGWLVYNITDDGVPQALEPKNNAPEGVVNWKTSVNHVDKTLKHQGHTDARLWTEADGTAIFNNIVKGNHNDKARLDVSGSHPDGRYWETTESPNNALVNHQEGGNKFWRFKDNDARVRGVQDVPELSL